MRATAFGDAAGLVDLDLPANANRSNATIAAAAALKRAFPEADVVSGAGQVLVVGAAVEAVARALASLDHVPTSEGPWRVHRIAVCFDGEDLDETARATKLGRAELIARLAAAELSVELLGFMPGFAYLGELEPALVVPRRPSPRRIVPARSVAIAGKHAGIYPFASPGGWNLVGRAIDFVPFDAARDPAVAFAPGDRVFLEPSERPFLELDSPRALPVATANALEVLVAPACATIQDGGRPGLLHRGIPSSGPLDLEAHAAANAAVGNMESAATIEVALGTLEVKSRGRVRVARDGEPARTLADGDTLHVEPKGRTVRYLAVTGGVDVPPELGSRATLLSARIGGFGRALRRGDVVPVFSDSAHAESIVRFEPRLDASISVLRGPHLDRFAAGAFERFLETTFTISRLLDRVGVRLEGARIERHGVDDANPTPMLRGAVQVTSDGTPIVLGPDHPTTGGYPVLAVVPRAGWSLLARRLPGSKVRFRV